MKSLPLNLFLPILLTSMAPFTDAAPRVPGKAPGVVKRPILNADSALVAAQFERIAKAYSSLGSFSMMVLETKTIKKKIDRTKYTAYFGADGRLGIKMAEIDGHDQATGNNFTQLYDGQEIITAINSEPEERSEVKNTDQKTNPALATNFFSHTATAQLIAMLSKYNRAPEGYKPYGTYSIQTLPDGKVHIKNTTRFRFGKEAVSGTTEYIIGSSGFIERLEANIVEDGTTTFHAIAILGRPAVLSAGSLTWEKFVPPPNTSFSIDAPSREVFERAAGLYSKAKSFTIKISGTVQHSDQSAKESIWTAEIALERRGRLRLQSSRSPIIYAYDGTNSHVIADGALRKVPTFTSSPDELIFQVLRTIVPDGDPFERFNELLIHLLQGETTDFSRSPRGLDSRKVTLEADTTLYGLSCKVVNIVGTVNSKTEPVTLQDRYWFAQSDGRLLRVTSSLTTKEGVDTTDVRLNGQKLDAQLPDSTWVLTAPAKRK